jgi:dihydrofolate reductase
MISMIVAADLNGNIGYDNKLLWNLPADMKFFREKTIGHTVVMGRKTFESIGKPLPKRKNIVLSKESKSIPDVVVCNQISDLFFVGKNHDKEYFIIGGSEIYEQFLPHTDRIYMTVVNAQFDVTKRKYDKFPLHIGRLANGEGWNGKLLGVHLKDEKHKYDCIFHQFDRA